jgi:hypothetical protein
MEGVEDAFLRQDKIPFIFFMIIIGVQYTYEA